MWMCDLRRGSGSDFFPLSSSVLLLFGMYMLFGRFGISRKHVCDKLTQAKFVVFVSLKV